MFGTPCAVHSLNLAFKTIIVEVVKMKKYFDEAKERPFYYEGPTCINNV